jgi:hypothetical protein
MTSVGADFIRIGGKMKKLLLTGIAALFLATGAANAGEKCDTTHTSDLPARLSITPPSL